MGKMFPNNREVRVSPKEVADMAKRNHPSENYSRSGTLRHTFPANRNEEKRITWRFSPEAHSVGRAYLPRGAAAAGAASFVNRCAGPRKAGPPGPCAPRAAWIRGSASREDAASSPLKLENSRHAPPPPEAHKFEGTGALMCTLSGISSTRLDVTGNNEE